METYFYILICELDLGRACALYTSGVFTRLPGGLCFCYYILDVIGLDFALSPSIPLTISISVSIKILVFVGHLPTLK